MGPGAAAQFITYSEDGGGAAFEITELAQGTSLSNYAIGVATIDRIILIAVHWREGGVHRSLSSASIGGIGATIALQEGHSGGSTGFGVAFIYAVVPTGTTADISLSFTGSVTLEAIGGWRIVGSENATPTDTGSDENSGFAFPLSAFVTVEEGGIVVGAYSSSTNARNDAPVWTNAQEAYDYIPDGIRVSGAVQTGVPANANYEVEISNVSQPDSGNALILVSWI